MDMTIDQHVALDEAIVPHASRLRIGKSNFCLKSNISSKESTLYGEFLATVMVHHYSIRSFAAIINKCLSGKSTGYDSLRLPQALILWGLYHKRNVDFAYRIWEDFFYQVEHKDAKKSNETYYSKFTKVIVHYFMSKDPSIPRRNRVNWNYVRDDKMFTTIKLVYRHQNTQQFSAMLPIELNNADIINSEAYKEYYVVATGATPPKTKASVRKPKSSSDTTVTPLPTTAAGTRLSTSAKGKQPAKASKAKSLTILTEKSSDDQDGRNNDDDQEEGSDDDQDSDKEGEEFIHPKLSIHDEEETKDEESFDPIAKTPKNSDDEGNDKENLGLNVGMEEGQDEEDDEDELYGNVNINLEARVVQMADVHTTQEFKDSHVTLTLVNPDGQQQSSSMSLMDVQVPTTVSPLPLSAPTLTPSTITTISTVPQAPTPPTTASSTLLQDLPNFGSLFGFDHRLKTLEANFSEFMQTNQFAGVISSIPGIVQRYIDQRMNEAVKVTVQIQSDRLCDEAQAENKEFLKNLNKNIQKIIKEQVKEQVKALIEAYESDKIILDTYGDTVMLKRRRDDDADKDQETSAGSDQGSKRQREGKEPESTSAPKEKATKTTDKSTQGSKSRQTSASESATVEEPMQTTHDLEEPSHPEFETGADDQPIAEPSQHPKWFSQQKKPPTPDRDWNKTLSTKFRIVFVVTQRFSHCYTLRLLCVAITLTQGSASDETGKKKGSTVTLTTKDMQKRKNDVKARTTLLLSLPDEHQLRFSKYKTAQELWAAILKTISGNEATKKTKKNLLKQQYGNFKAEGSETLEQTLAPEWLMHTIVWRNRSDINTMSLDDLYNHLKVYESEVYKKSKSNSQNMAFISSAKHSSGNEEVNTASVSTASTNVPTASANIRVASISQDTACAYIAFQSSGSQIKFEDINQIDEDDIKVMDIKWNMTLLSMRVDSKITELTDKLCDAKNMIYHYKLALAQVESRLDEHKSRELKYCEKIRVLEFNTESKANCIESLTKDLDLLKKEKGYSAVPPPPAQIYSPPKKDMCPRANDSPTKSKTDKVKTAKKPPVKYAEQYKKLTKKPSVRGNQRKWNNLKSHQLDYWDSGCSRHMTDNISYLSDYEPFDEGYVSFGQGGCKITGKGTIKTSKLEFENVYFVKDLKDFKLLDDANVLFRTPRQHNMYSIDLNNIVPHKDLTCLVAKASADEGMLWHRTLGHLNFKTMNRLVRHNLVRGLPSKCFENDHTCTACLKGKQHKASCKSKLVNSITKPLHTLHMDLFGATSVSSISHKWYCLVVTDNFSGFAWTFFLKTKDETSGILRKFITEIENLKDLKVNIIRCDNEGEFRNKEMDDFCSQKGIKRKFSNARTPQQNGVAERRNRTLIEAARTILADAKLLVTFWAKAVNTACTNSTNFLGTKDAASQEVKKDVSSLRYIALPNWVHDALLESSSSKPQDDCSTDVPESSGNSNSTATSTNPLADQLETITVETPIPTISSPVPTAYFTNSQEPSSDTRLILKRVANQVETPSLDNILTLTNWFEDILRVTTNSVNSDGVKADVSNMETTITASPTPTLRIHKDHPKSQIIGPVDTPIQTRSKSKEEEGIDYDEVFAPVARIEAIRLFLAYASFMGFTVYQMDVKSAFLYGTIDEEVYVTQHLRFQDPEFPARVYKVEKAIEFEALIHEKFHMSAMCELNFFLGLQVLQKEDGIFLSQDKYVGDILKKFGYSDVRSANTPLDKENP
nr:hypothetical protein [Tanacetum cinerariifolium]